MLICPANLSNTITLKKRLLIARGIDPQGDIPVTSDMGEIRTAILNTLCDKFDQFYQKLEQDPALIEAPFAEAKRRLELLENPAGTIVLTTFCRRV
jgi:hypothetical protein